MSQKKLSDSAKDREDWMNRKWRPMMGWVYMMVCLADFIVFPVLWSIIQASSGGEVRNQWIPITLQGAGLFHVAMGVVLGLTTWGRTQEKINAYSFMQPRSAVLTTTYGEREMQSDSYVITRPVTRPSERSRVPEVLARPNVRPDD